MSFQRIFEMVRRQGMPMVVTDETGKEPVVVLPFEVYEAMVEGGEPKPVPTQPSARLERIANEVVQEVEKELEQKEVAELSLEERFYVVPMEDQENR